MTLDVGRRYQHRHHKVQWHLLLVVPILLAILVIGFLIYDAVFAHKPTPLAQTYQYTVDQALTYDVTYLDNNYFATGKVSPHSTAYVRELTDTISTNFSYIYQTDKGANLSYTYAATARVVASYTPRGTSDTKVVWDATYPLVRATAGDGQQGNVRLQTDVVVPFREYSQQIARMNSGLALSLSAEAIVTFSVSVTGTANSLPVNEQRTMQMTVPLDQAIYAVATKYDQRDAKTITADSTTTENVWWRSYRTTIIVTSSVLLILSVVLLAARPWRRDTERNPYKRELNRIYRYHDGLIIRTQKPFDLQGREGLSVASFDDLLNLSEELRLPIIASQLSPEATRFFVIHNTTIYSYTVGEIRTTTQTVPILPRDARAKKAARKKT